MDDHVLTANGGIVAVRDEFNTLRGHLFEAVEVMGMWPKQEDAFKGMIRGFTYEAQRSIEAKLRKREEE